ncbi:RidA family protein [Comamonas humi]
MHTIQRHQPGPRMSQAVICNGIAFLSGQVPKTTLNEGITAQAGEVLAQVDALLAEVGSSKRHLLSCSIVLRDMADFDAWNAVWDHWVDAAHTPARTTVQAAMARPLCKVEVTVTAALA